MNPLKAMKQDAAKIFEAGIHATDPGKAIKNICRLEDRLLYVGKNKPFDLSGTDHIFVIGVGKATARMAKPIEQILGKRITAGLISVKYGHGESLDYIQTIEAGHPIPDENGVIASRKILGMVEKASQRDLIICLISGGGSALLPLPAGNVSLVDKQRVTGLLLGCGADIHDINTIRKHLSAIKGGRLAQACAPATVVSFILSDVVGDDLDVIASGPCVPDSSTFETCRQIIDKYRLGNQMPPSVASFFKNASGKKENETPKPGAPFFKNTFNYIVCSNQMALAAAKKAAQKRGYNSLILSSMIEGQTHTMAQIHAAIAKEVLKTGQPIKPPACILSGGETTLEVTGNGLGGRNQEAALVAAFHISGNNRIVMLCAGSDGTDGPTDAAGAFADTTTLERAGQQGVEPAVFLADNNAYPFFKLLDDLFITGPTGTNVMDFNIILVDR